MLTSGCLYFVAYRPRLLPPQVAQGALLGPLFHSPKNYVLIALQGAPRKAQRSYALVSVGPEALTYACTPYPRRPAPFPFARTTRSGLSEGSTRAVKERLPRFTGRSGSSMSTVCSATRRTARACPLASTRAMSLLSTSSWTRTGVSFCPLDIHECFAESYF